MTTKQRLRSSCAVLTLLGLMQGPTAFAQSAPMVENAPRSSALVGRFATDMAREVALSPANKLSLLKQRIKYVFVLFQENRAFDHYFGTFPGAHGLFSQPASVTPGFVQRIVNTDGSEGTISPFLIPQTVTDVNGKTVQLYPADTDSVDHSHTGIVNSLHVDRNNMAHNDLYALNEEGLTVSHGQIVSIKTGQPAATPPTLAQKQRAELVVSHLDCDTIPFLWQYADRFALMDEFHQTIIGPSTPNAIAMIAGQSGETQWARHPNESSKNTSSGVIATSGGEPVVGDPPPFNGSNLDTSPVKPTLGGENPNTPALNQTYATLPLSFMGKNINAITQADQNPAFNLRDVQNDIGEIASHNPNQVPWGWYQEGFDLEPTDADGVASHAGYITHHNGPQYFGYIADNTKEVLHLHGLNDFFKRINNGKLPQEGGVFYVRGGYTNNDGLVPVDPNPTVQKNFTGNDDHPAYSDAQISEALVADEINAIASSPYWNQSAIIVTYDETDGLYDHAPIQIRSYDPEGAPLANGPRVPTVVISPYGRSHVIVHEHAEHSSVIKFINNLFGLEPLADLPDEVRGRKEGQARFGQGDLGPADDKVPYISDLLSTFDNNRLLGKAEPLPPSYALIQPGQITSLPHYAGKGCYTLNMVPTDYRGGTLLDPAPADFNPRPGTTPGVPTSGTWTP